MQAKTDYKKQLTLKGNAVKRTVKEFQYYIKDVIKEQTKLKQMEDAGQSSEGDLGRQKDIVNECVGSKQQTFTNLEKFYQELNTLLTTIDSPAEDEEEQKLRDNAKGLKEYAAAKEHWQNAKETIEKEKALTGA